MRTNIVGIRYEDVFNPQVFGGKCYYYYTAIPLKIGDLVIAPTSNGDKIARVSEIDIDEWKVENIKSYLKLIVDKIDKEKY